jgi:hypothetical protein
MINFEMGQLDLKPCPPGANDIHLRMNRGYYTNFWGKVKQKIAAKMQRRQEKLDTNDHLSELRWTRKPWSFTIAPLAILLFFEPFLRPAYF